MRKAIELAKNVTHERFKYIDDERTLLVRNHEAKELSKALISAVEQLKKAKALFRDIQHSADLDVFWDIGKLGELNINEFLESDIDNLLNGEGE